MFSRIGTYERTSAVLVAVRRFLRTAFAVLLAAGTAACAGLSEAGSARAGSPIAASHLYGIAGPPPARLLEVDSRTLRPLPGWQIPLDAHSLGWSFSPDRSRLALGSDQTGELRLLDLRQRRVLGDVAVRVSGSASTLASAWAGSSRVLAALVTPGCCGLGDSIVAGIAAAPHPRLVWQRRLGGSLQAGARFRRSLVLVLGPRGPALGASRLVVVGPRGRVQTALLPEIRSGFETSGGRDPDKFVSHVWNPGLAVDPDGARAFVVQAGAPVAEVELRTLRVRYHELSEPVSLLGRLHDWFEPRAQAKASEGPTRQALWLGNGLLAVTGTDSQAALDANGQERQWETAAGLKLIDTRRWSVRTLDPRATRAIVAADTLFGYGITWDSRSQTIGGSGLTAYSLAGDELFHRYGDQPISDVQPVGTRVLVGGSVGSRLFDRSTLLDARSGRELRHVRTGIGLLIGDEPFWY